MKTAEEDLQTPEDRERRLVKSYTTGSIDDGVIEREVKEIRERRASLADRFFGFAKASRRIEEWMLNADGDDFTLLLDAL